MTEMFEELQQRDAGQTIQDEAGRRLRGVVEEVEKMRRGMEDKLRQIQGTPPPQRGGPMSPLSRPLFWVPELEDKIRLLIRRREEKAADVSTLVEVVEKLRRDISKRAEEYSGCTS